MTYGVFASLLNRGAFWIESQSGDLHISILSTAGVFAMKLNTYIELSPDELSFLAKMQARPQKMKRGSQLIQDGQIGHKAFLLQAGWTCSYKDLPNGRRQIISFPIAGDCVGMRGVLRRTAHHSFSALTDAVVSPVQSTDILECINDFPRLSTALMWAASRDEAMAVERLVSLGRRNATERTAHFFIELAERMSLVGLAIEAEFECPLSQFVLADALGLTAIHINRILRQLRDDELITFRKGRVRIHDLDRLSKIAGFCSGSSNSRNQGLVSG
jgi:CRP-like cAMP-binding protein